MRTIAFLDGLSISAVGCGGPGDGLDRQPVSGSITIDGAPLASGLITFVPASAPGPVATAPIRDGSYALSRAEGPAPGPHRVTIWASEATGNQIHDPYFPDEPIEETREIIPSRYNSESVLTADVQSGDENAFPFELTGMPTAPVPGRSASTRGTSPAR